MLTLAAAYLSLIAIPYMCPERMAVTSHAIGPLTLGQNVSAIRSGYPYLSEAFEDDGDGGIRYTVTVCGNVDIEATTAGKGKTVSILRSSSPVFVTDKGAKSGMTVAELRRLYPKGKTNVLEGEGLIASFDTGAGIYFGLDQDAIPRRCYEYRANCDVLLNRITAVDVFIQGR